MMTPEVLSLCDRLTETQRLSEEEYAALLSGADQDTAALLAARADKARRAVYGDSVFIRGLIEIGNICKNDCYYCGIRRSNRDCARYTLSEAEILDCCAVGYPLGFRTFVLQSGEGSHSVDKICRIVAGIKDAYPDCAVTLSLGEYPRADYARMRRAGADRYLLRHETADEAHYARLHPEKMSHARRIACLYDLRDLGFAVGCGFMVGSPYQTVAHLAKDLKFVEDFSPDMCGIGPFIPHHATPFRDFPAGSVETTCLLLSILRLQKHNLLLPATTALGTLDPCGREKGILAGANVVMPNLSPVGVRKKYDLYDNKICTGDESAQCRACLETRVRSIGYTIVTDRGDARK